MDFSLDANTDEDFFGSLKRQNTNLDNLFGLETQHNLGNDDQDTLKYQPVKQTPTNLIEKKPTSSPSTTVQAWQTILAKVAQAYKEGVAMGKVGVALLKSVENEYRIIIYKAKLNVLTTCSLRTETVQIHRHNNYLQFYDDDLCCWSVYFDASANTEEFVAKLIEVNIKIGEDVNKERKEFIPETEPAQLTTEDVLSNNQLFLKSLEKPPIAPAKPTKTTLITRMAKMGQQLPKMELPAHVQSSGEVTDSSDTETISTPMTTPRHIQNSTPRSSNRALATTQAIPISQINHYPLHSNLNSGFESQFMQMMMTENRTQSSELRMNINRLEGKVEKVLDKIDLLHTSSSHKLNKEDEILLLEEKVLELKKENRKLRQTIEERSEIAPHTTCQQIMRMYSTELAEVKLANVDSLEKLVGDLLKQRTALHEKLEEWDKELTEKSLQLKTHQIRLNDDQDMLANTIASKHQLEEELKTMQQRLEESENNESELRQQLALSNKEILAQRQLSEECKQREAQVNNSLLELQTQNATVQKKLEEMEKMDLENQRHNAATALRHDSELTVEQQIETVLKKTMNNLYASLAAKLETIVPMQKHAVIAIVGKTIREETLRAMDELEE
ncbi:CAP-Gly domain-containing linker protein 1 [Zeugodacus cucurbitae]|uniref:CAP-Gly domain-containing linker protein 1 n=1 Tax=Zeugodacus cucurbitae TaxID=28588 RepID=UPI0005969E57|nr:CAP-Gly domain-containing linker protein 1 [Zeugodacus cucurbitae]